MSDPLNEMREAIQETAAAQLPAFQRLQRLRGMRAELQVAVDENDAAIVVAEAARDEERAGLSLAILALRERATISEGLVEDGVATEQEIAESGVLSHTDLDELEGEGLLEATAQGLIEQGVLDVAGEWTASA